MGSSNPFKDHPPFIRNKLFTYTLYALLPIAVVSLYLYPLLPISPTNPFRTETSPISTTESSSSLSYSTLPREEQKSHAELPCDYTNGKWVHDKRGPLYNGTSCKTITEGQNCQQNGRPDTGYLYWIWKPHECKLSRFEANIFLQILRNKHMGFVGDSLARNQMESLLCMLATSSAPDLIYSNVEDRTHRWRFHSHNITVSSYWSPFIVKGIEKTKDGNGPKYNKLFLDSVDKKWAADLDGMDMLVLSVGHWFLQPSVFFDGDSVLGCHFCNVENYTEIGFYNVFGKAIKTTLKTIMETRGGGSKTMIDVVLTTFTPAHFEGEWDKLYACSKKEPYKEGEKDFIGINAEMRKAELDEVELAKKNGENFRSFRLEALDVTKLALTRPDGHPGPYMHPFPFANGVRMDHVKNDCVHWCLPGPIDTWNAILLDIMKRWHR